MHSPLPARTIAAACRTWARQTTLRKCLPHHDLYGVHISSHLDPALYYLVKELSSSHITHPALHLSSTWAGPVLEAETRDSETMQSATEKSLAEPTTPHCRASPARPATSIPPPTPSKPKTRETRLVLGDETADFAIVCGGTRFMAHKAVLSASSPYFERMFRFSGSVRFPLSFPYFFFTALNAMQYRRLQTDK